MLVNLWSTPRTGSNWYVQSLLKDYQKTNSRTKILTQYFNTYHLINYIKPKFGDFVYEYEPSCSYRYYFFNEFEKAISYKQIFKSRQLNSEQELDYRTELFNKHNFSKNPIIFYHHIGTIDDNMYNMLFNKADRNIFLYRKDFKRQLSSYALAYGTHNFKPSKLVKPSDDVHVNYEVLKNLTDRIIKWYDLYKTNSDVVCYENLNFSEYKDLPQQQNTTDPFLKVDEITKQSILDLEIYFKNSIQKSL